ncbi:Uncharacterised protein [Enterobacter hormaechei]|nr:Uncharacterised protein [Enterobacter hormaechei]
MRVSEISNPCVFIRPRRKLRFGCAIETLLALPVGFTHQRARVSLERLGQIGIDHQADSLLRGGGSDFMQQDCVVVHAVDLGYPVSAGSALLLVRFKLVEECGHTGMNRRNVFTALNGSDTLKKLPSTFRLAGTGHINPLFEIDAITGLLNVAVPRTYMACVNPFWGESRHELTVNLRVPKRCQGALQPLIVGVDLLLRVQAAIHDDVRWQRVARQHQVLTPVVCFAPDRLAIHLRGDVDLHRHSYFSAQA